MRGGPAEVIIPAVVVRIEPRTTRIQCEVTHSGGKAGRKVHAGWWGGKNGLFASDNVLIWPYRKEQCRLMTMANPFDDLINLLCIECNITMQILSSFFI